MNEMSVSPDSTSPIVPLTNYQKYCVSISNLFGVIQKCNFFENLKKVPINFPSGVLYPKSAPFGFTKIGVKLNDLTTVESISPSSPLKLFARQMSFMRYDVCEAFDRSVNFIDVGYRSKNEILNGNS